MHPTHVPTVRVDDLPDPVPDDLTLLDVREPVKGVRERRADLGQQRQLVATLAEAEEQCQQDCAYEQPLAHWHGNGRRACLEIMINTPLAQDLIRKGEVSELKELMKRSTELGMQTFDQALYALSDAGEITYEDALRNADSVNDLRLQIKLNSQRAKSQDLSAGTEHLAIV